VENGLPCRNLLLNLLGRIHRSKATNATYLPINNLNPQSNPQLTIKILLGRAHRSPSPAWTYMNPSLQVCRNDSHLSEDNDICRCNSVPYFIRLINSTYKLFGSHFLTPSSMIDYSKPTCFMIPKSLKHPSPSWTSRSRYPSILPVNAASPKMSITESNIGGLSIP
jgi:hypothetical protein